MRVQIQRREPNQRLPAIWYRKTATHNKVFRLENETVKTAVLLVTSVMMEAHRSKKMTQSKVFH